MVRSTRSRRRNTRRSIPRNAATMGQLGRWFKAMHEKLGWITLAQAKGLNSKVVEYKRSLAHLVESIEYVMGEYTNMNRIHDLKVLLMEAKALVAYVDKHL